MAFSSLKRKFLAAFQLSPRSSQRASSSTSTSNSESKAEGEEGSSPSKKLKRREAETDQSSSTVHQYQDQAPEENMNDGADEPIDEDAEEEEEEEVHRELTKESKGKERESELEAELREMRDTYARLYQDAKLKSEALERIKENVQCVICQEVIRNPQVLTECGHSCCYKCLRGWWTQPRRNHLLAVDERSISTDAESESDDDDDDTPTPDADAAPTAPAPVAGPSTHTRHHFRPVIHYFKRCPECQAIIIRRPVPDFRLRHIIDAARLTPLSTESQESRDKKWSSKRVDMWRGIFPAAGYEDDVDEWFDEPGVDVDVDVEGRGGDVVFNLMDDEDEVDPILEHWAVAQARAREEARARREAEDAAFDEHVQRLVGAFRREFRREQGPEPEPEPEPELELEFQLGGRSPPPPPPAIPVFTVPIHQTRPYPPPHPPLQPEAGPSNTAPSAPSVPTTPGPTLPLMSPFKLGIQPEPSASGGPGQTSFPSSSSSSLASSSSQTPPIHPLQPIRLLPADSEHSPHTPPDQSTNILQSLQHLRRQFNDQPREREVEEEEGEGEDGDGEGEDGDTDFTLFHAMLHGDASTSTSTPPQPQPQTPVQNPNQDQVEQYPVYIEDLHLPDVDADANTNTNIDVNVNVVPPLPAPAPAPPASPTPPASQYPPPAPSPRTQNERGAAFDDTVDVITVHHSTHDNNYRPSLFIPRRNRHGTGPTQSGLDADGSTPDEHEESEGEDEDPEERLARLVREGELACLEENGGGVVEEEIVMGYTGTPGQRR